MCLEEPCFVDWWKVSLVVSVFKDIGEKSSFFCYKVFEKLVRNGIVDLLEKLAFFLISSMVLGLPDQLQIF